MSKVSSYKYNQKIVLPGGGTGPFTLLTGLVEQNNPNLITALAGTWDSGRSSGRLRTEYGILPPGDARQCLVALMKDKHQRSIALSLFNDRSLNEHSFGNLMLKILRDIYHGDQEALDQARALFKVKSDIVYSSNMELTLVAKYRSGLEIEGEGEIDHRWSRSDYNPADKTSLVYFTTRAEPTQRTLKALQEADKIVFPSGSLWGSIIPHLLIDGVQETIQHSKAKVVFVLNLMTERGQTDSFKASDHLKEFLRYLGKVDCLDYMIVNSTSHSDKEVIELYKSEGQTLVEFDEEECRKIAPNLKIIEKPLVRYLKREHLIRHDPYELTSLILSLD